MRRDMLCHWMSTAKPVAAIAIGQLLDRQLLSLASPVATHIPEFGCHGKEAVLVEHLLTHTSGFPFADSECWRDSMGDWSRVLDAICRARLEKDWVPGERAGYHPSSSWFVLGELVRRCDGRPFEQYVRECIFEPLGMHDCHIGMGEAACARYMNEGRIAELSTRGLAAARDDGFATPAAVRACVPGGNLRGPAWQVARLFRCLLDDGRAPDGGAALLQPATARLLRTRRRLGMYDEVQRLTCDWGLGLFVGAVELVGTHASPETFGHGGSQSSVGFADPEAQLVAAVAFNRRCGPEANAERMHRVATALYEDLGLRLASPS